MGGAIAFVVTLVTTPAGVSGAVLLLPVQISVLHVPNPALTPTNLLYNVLSTPGALTRFARERRLGSPLTRALLVGTVPACWLAQCCAWKCSPARAPSWSAVRYALQGLGWADAPARPARRHRRRSRVVQRQQSSSQGSPAA